MLITREKQVVLLLLVKGPLCVSHAAKILGLESNQLSGVFLKLRTKGIISKAGTGTTKNNCDCALHELSELNEVTHDPK